MSTAINSSQSTTGRPNSLRNIFSRDDQALAEKQSTTFDQLLAGFDWKPIEAPEDSADSTATEEVVETDSASKPEETKKEEKETSDSSEKEVVATDEAMLQTDIVATVQTAQKVDTPIEQKSLVKEGGEGEKVAATVESKGIENVAEQAVVVQAEEKPVEVTQQVDETAVEEVALVDPRVHEHRERRRKDEVVNKSDTGPKVAPVVAQSQQQTKVEAKKETKVEHQESVLGKPTQNMEEVKTNRRSRKERLAENAENPQGNDGQKGISDELSDRQVGQKPDVSVKPPEQPLEVQQLPSATATPQIVAAPAPQAPVASTGSAELRGGERAQGINGVQNNSNSTQRSEGNTGSANRSDAAQKNANAKKTEEKSGVDQRQQIRLIQRVARGFERIGEQGGNIRLRLHPPELGSLAMTVRVEGKTLSAEIVTETVQARQALVDNLPQLKQQLSESGLTIEKFDVRVMDQQSQFSGQTFSGQSSGQNSSQSSGSWNQSSNRRTETLKTASGRTSAYEAVGLPTSLSTGSLSRSLDVEV